MAHFEPESGKFLRSDITKHPKMHIGSSRGQTGTELIVARIIIIDDKTLTFGNNGSVVAAPPPLVHYMHTCWRWKVLQVHLGSTVGLLSVLYSQSQVTRETWRLHYHQPSPASTAATLSHGQSNGSLSRPAAFCKLAVSFTFLFSFFFSTRIFLLILFFSSKTMAPSRVDPPAVLCNPSHSMSECHNVRGTVIAPCAPSSSCTATYRIF